MPVAPPEPLKVPHRAGRKGLHGHSAVECKDHALLRPYFTRGIKRVTEVELERYGLRATAPNEVDVEPDSITNGNGYLLQPRLRLREICGQRSDPDPHA